MVLVMTILGILFVVGVAFLASMNFEADMIVFETQRERADSRVAEAVDQLGSTLRDGLMSDYRMPFGNPSAALSATSFAEMPGVQTSFSAIEPQWEFNDPMTPDDDQIVFSPYIDMTALKQQPYVGPLFPKGFAIDTRLPNGAQIDNLPDGTNLKRCVGGTNKGVPCDSFPGECPGSVCEGPRVLDADGDGIVDSLQVDAKVLGFSDSQLSTLASRLNSASNPSGRVFVGVRVLPHGGLVNLNASHPKLIENILNVPDLRAAPNPADDGNFYHRPTQNQVAYSPLLEEPSLRRRSFLAPRIMSPSWLHGDPLLDPGSNPTGNADMQWQLFPPKEPDGVKRLEYESVFKHRSWPFNPSHDTADPSAEWYNPSFTDLGTLWDVRMEPFTSAGADPTGREYDRRHLVTTISHDDLLARGGRVPNSNVPGGEEDILNRMAQANQTAWDPDRCPDLPFEYVHYPQTIPDNCCPTDVGCRLNARKGRLQLSLPYLDDQIAEAIKLPDLVERRNALERIFRLIHDAFYLLVRNAAHVTTLEGTPCAKRCLDGINRGAFCPDDTACPGSICQSVDCVYANGACGTNGLCTVAAGPLFIDCATYVCSIPGSVCRADLNPPNGVCVIQAPIWQDVPCLADPTVCNILSGETCDPILDRCVDVRTGQTHSQTLIARTAASLTANFIDYADSECSGGARNSEFCALDTDCPGGTCAGIPTRIALRSLDLTMGHCIRPLANIGFSCDMDTDCGTDGRCLPPRGMCVRGSKTGRACGSDAACGTGGICNPPAKAAGREFDFDPAVATKFEYVYGLERQPYITEIATLAFPPPAPVAIVAQAIELFNPYDVDIDATGYSIVEVDDGGALKPPIALAGTLPAKSFTIFASGSSPSEVQLLTLPATTSQPIPTALQFRNGWTIYLVRGVSYDPGVNTEIVVDQFMVPLTGSVGNLDPGIPPAIYSLQRLVKPPPSSPWTATVPKAEEISADDSLGDWNDFASVQPPHPVEVNFANLGFFSRPFVSADARNGSVAFPTTGSMLLLMRHANRSLPQAGEPFVRELAFTTHLVGDTIIKNPVGAILATISADQQIDNGRMPVFDEPVHSPPPPGGDDKWYSAHHLSPSVTQRGAPGNLDTLPWGQMVFDYFTALPLNNAGPYVDIDPGPAAAVASPESQPRVDLEGLRVHGRININVAPWRVLAGLPYIPMGKVPLPFRAGMRRALSLVKRTAADPLAPAPSEFEVPDAEAARIGAELAQAIVAYRELRPLPGIGVNNLTGNYADGTPFVTPTPPGPPIYYARGWDPTTPGTPPTPVPLMARRGTGFMTVGELANVRHLGADSVALPPGFPKSFYRIDAGLIDGDQSNNNTENFVDAVASMVALGDWVTVRSQVFTVYGVFRGEEDPAIADPKLRVQDADSRALRFQETIDRLPTFLGEPVPSRIGGRILARYTDVYND